MVNLFQAGVVVTTAATCLAAAGAQASTFKLLYTAPHGQAAAPAVSLVQGQILYGIDPAAGLGIVFQLAPGGHYTPLHVFSGADGSQPNARLAINSKGTLYGTTQTGGSAGQGTVFELTPKNGKLKTLYAFTGSPDGAVPRDGMAMDRSGTLYGTASEGDLSPGNGEIFSMTRNGKLSVRYLFKSGTDGHCPFSGVALGGTSLYGTTVGLGFGGQPTGSVFQYQPSTQKLTTLHTFTNGADGEYPTITPTQDGYGNLYGVSNGQNGQPYAGALWTITKNGFAILHNFTGGADGYLPNGPLQLGRDRMLYGTTAAGGSATGPGGYGTVFRISAAGMLTTLYTFTGGTDGGAPTGSLAFDSAGNVYGGTSAGTIYRITP